MKDDYSIKAKEKLLSNSRRVIFDLVEEYEQNISEYSTHADHLMQVINDRENQINQLVHNNEALRGEMNELRSTLGFRVYNRLVELKAKVLNRLGQVKSRARRSVTYMFDRKIDKNYQDQLLKVPVGGKKKAIVLHLYYVDMWSYFYRKLETILNSGEYTLVVNIPHITDEAMQGVEKQIKRVVPDAIVIYSHNKGRDVLSFLHVARRLESLGYDYVLKLHSKKSPQRHDGEDWSDGIISRLVAEDGKKLGSIEKVFRDTNTSMIGPADSYVPLTTYYNDNQPKIYWLLSEIFGQKAADDINTNNGEYGFFAGTMFWVRLSSIKPILDLPLTANNFPSESAQLDGTVAHALERLLCIVPEYSNMDIYEASNIKVKKIPYKTEFIPDWSDYHHVKNN